MNNKMQHTPGPWKAPSAGIWTAGGECMIASVGHRDIIKSRRAYARKYFFDDAHHNPAEMMLLSADARLIAAAPDLLAALMTANSRTQHGETCTDTECHCWKRFAAFAISKATGRKCNHED